MSEYITDDIFGVDVKMMTEIHVDEEEEAKQYILSMAERIAKMRTQSELENEALKANADANSSISIVMSDDSVQVDEPYCIDINAFIEVKKDGKIYTVPNLKKHKAMEDWRNIVSHHTKRLHAITTNLSRCACYSKELLRIVEKFNQWQSIDVSEVKNKAASELAKRTVAIYEAETAVSKLVGTLAEAMRNVHCQVDDETNGVWIDAKQFLGDQETLKGMCSNRIILNRRFNFNARQTNNLINLVFSTEPDIRAEAKLDLGSQLRKDVFHEVLLQPEKSLEVICAEACLTAEEVLHMVFPKQAKDCSRMCINCRTAVSLSGTFYHKKCKTILWLSTHCRFQYDEIDQCLIGSGKKYISPECRRAIIEILKYHAQLRRDIVTKTSTNKSDQISKSQVTG